MIDIITKDEAIDRMKAGLPCETWNKYLGGGEWRKTEWDDFTDAHKFRKPPEPRRVAQDYWIYNGDVFMHKVHPDAIHAREVLPGDVVLQRMTEAEAHREFENQHGKRMEQYFNWWLTSRRALGLIKEGS